MTDERSAIGRTYVEYFKAFQTLDPEAILPCYDVPFLVLAPGMVRAVNSRAEARALFADMMKALGESGYARSEWTRLGVKQLSDVAALVSCGVARYKTDGSLLGRFGATYAFRRTDAGWRIAMLAIHDADAVLDFPPWEP